MTGWQIYGVLVVSALLIIGVATSPLWARAPKPLRYPQLRGNVKDPPKPQQGYTVQGEGLFRVTARTPDGVLVFQVHALGGTAVVLPHTWAGDSLKWEQARVGVSTPNLTPDVVLSWDEAEGVHRRAFTFDDSETACVMRDAMRRAREGR